MSSPNSRYLIIDAMPATLALIRRRTGLARSTISRAVIELHQAGKCHVSNWAPSAAGAGAPLLAVYKMGVGDDVPCPVVIKPRVKGEPVDGNARARLKALADADRVSKTKDPFLWWCFDVKTSF